MTDENQKKTEDEKPTISADLARLKKLARQAAIVGAILGVICPMIPPQYQTPCNTVASFLGSCTGGLLP